MRRVSQMNESMRTRCESWKEAWWRSQGEWPEQGVGESQGGSHDDYTTEQAREQAVMREEGEKESIQRWKQCLHAWCCSMPLRQPNELSFVGNRETNGFDN